MNLSYTIFSDESCTTPPHRCYGIGSLVVPDSRVTLFNRACDTLADDHGVTGEFKWTNIRNGRELNRCAQGLVNLVQSMDLSFHAMIVSKDHFRKWNENRENGYYTSLYFQIRHILRDGPSQYSLVMDERPDTYLKHDEALLRITNSGLKQAGAKTSLTSVTLVDSMCTRGIQVADVLIGAFSAAHNLAMNPNLKIHPAKREFMDVMAQSLGLPSLAVDTLPRSHMNVWQFPIQFRSSNGKPVTSGAPRGSGGAHRLFSKPVARCPTTRV